MFSVYSSCLSPYAHLNCNKQAALFARPSKNTLTFRGNTGESLLDRQQHYERYFNMQGNFDPDKAIMPWELQQVFKSEKKHGGYAENARTYNGIPVDSRIYVGREPFANLDEIERKDSYVLGVENRENRGYLSRTQGYFELVRDRKIPSDTPRYTLTYTDGVPLDALIQGVRSHVRDQKRSNKKNGRAIKNPEVQYYIPYIGAVLKPKYWCRKELQPGVQYEIKKGDTLILPSNVVYHF